MHARIVHYMYTIYGARACRRTNHTAAHEHLADLLVQRHAAQQVGHTLLQHATGRACVLVLLVFYKKDTLQN